MTIVAAVIGAVAVHDSDLRSARGAAYANYIGLHLKLHEFVYSNLYWAGEDATVPLEDEAAFWSQAAALQAELASAYVEARFVAYGAPVEERLIGLQEEQVTMFLEFKCKSGVQLSGCEQYRVRTDARALASEVSIAEVTKGEVEAVVYSWSNSATQLKEALIADAAQQLQ